MWEALVSGLIQVFSWPAIGYLAFGIVLGIWLGAMPGVGGVTGLILLLPFTYTMEPVSAFALMLGMFAVTTTSDTIASVMLGIPGTVASQATVLDGYPLAQKGQANRALGAAYTCSAVGGVVGALVLTASMPLIRPILTLFSTPEYFMLSLLGICMVGSLSSNSVAKGLVIGAFGMMLGTIGEGTFNGVPRYYFGVEYMLNTPPLVAVVLGLFAIPELLELATKNTSISRVPEDQSKGGGMLRGIRDVFANWWLVLKSSVLGTYIGMLPGLGASIVDWAAYGMAVQTTRGKNEFGRGDIRGVIAPESANNAQRGGALIPTLTFGIPGDFAMSILLGAMMIQGLRPGLEMLTGKLDITFAMIWTLIVANVVSALLLMALGRQVARAIFMDGHLLVPVVILFVFMGSWLGAQSMGDLILMWSMGALGLLMKRSGWPRPPLIIALVLGPNMENALVISNRIYGTLGWLERTPSLVIGAIILLTVAGAASGILRARRKGATVNTALDGKISVEGGERNPVVSIPLAILLAILFAVAGVLAIDFHPTNRQYPIAVCSVALVLLAIVLVKDGREALRIRSGLAGGWRAAWKAAAEQAELRFGFRFLLWVAVTVLLCWVVGQKFAIAAFILFYLTVWGKRPLWFAALYAAAGYAFVTLFYDRLMHIPFQVPLVEKLWAGLG